MEFERFMPAVLPFQILFGLEDNDFANSWLLLYPTKSQRVYKKEYIEQLGEGAIYARQW